MSRVRETVWQQKIQDCKFIKLNVIEKINQEEQMQQLYQCDIFISRVQLSSFVFINIIKYQIINYSHSNIETMEPSKNRNISKIVPKIQTFIQIPKPLQKHKSKKYPQSPSLPINYQSSTRTKISQINNTMLKQPSECLQVVQRQLQAFQSSVALIRPETHVAMGQVDEMNCRSGECESGEFKSVEIGKDGICKNKGNVKDSNNVLYIKKLKTQTQNNENLAVHIRKLGRKTKKRQLNQPQTSRQPPKQLQIMKEVQNCGNLRSDAQKRKQNITRMLTEVTQPYGDSEQFSSIALSQIKQNSYLSIVTSRQQNKRKYVRSSASLRQKNKPALTSRIMNPEESSNLAIQNQLLKLENEKLRRISDHRKNQISMLLKQILDLKTQIFDIFQENEGEKIPQYECQTIIKRQNSELSLLESSTLYQIQKSLGIIFSNDQQKHQNEQQIIQQKAQKQANQQTRKIIAKDIYNRLKNIITGDIQQPQSLQLS